MPVKPPREGKWWPFAGVSRRHRHDRPATSVPGVLLFMLIVGLGLVAVGAALVHAHARHALAGQDRSLAIAGLAMIVIGIVQARKLIRGG